MLLMSVVLQVCRVYPGVGVADVSCFLGQVGRVYLGFGVFYVSGFIDG